MRVRALGRLKMGSCCFNRSKKPGNLGTFVSGKTRYCHETFSATKIDFLGINSILFAAHNMFNYIS